MTTRPDPKRGEIWRVDLHPTRGAEIAKIRPCVVVNAEGIGRLPLRMIVPITEWDDLYASYDWMVRLDPTPENGLTKTSTADTFQTRPVSLDRFLQRVGDLTLEITDDIASAIAVCVDAP